MLQKLAADLTINVPHKKLASMEDAQILAKHRVHVFWTKSVKWKIINLSASKVIFSETKIWIILFHLIIFLVCQCQKQSDCRSNAVCDGCDCIERMSFTFEIRYRDTNFFFFIERDPLFPSGCEHCPPGVKCDPISGACINGEFFVDNSTLRALNVNALNNKLQKLRKCQKHLSIRFLSFCTNIFVTPKTIYEILDTWVMICKYLELSSKICLKFRWRTCMYQIHSFPQASLNSLIANWTVLFLQT